MISDQNFCIKTTRTTECFNVINRCMIYENTKTYQDIFISMHLNSCKTMCVSKDAINQFTRVNSILLTLIKIFNKTERKRNQATTIYYQQHKDTYFNVTKILYDNSKIGATLIILLKINIKFYLGFITEINKVI